MRHASQPLTASLRNFVESHAPIAADAERYDRPTCDLRKLVDVASSEEFERLLTQAVQHHGAPEDIPAWAERLANEAGKAND